MTQYELPDLPYDYAALEPHLSATVIQIHHDHHHRAYVANANKAVERLLEVRRKGDFSQIAEIERLLAFNVSGHVLHSIYWQNLTPEGGGPPSGVLGRAIERDFGGFDTFKQQLLHTASSIMGSGWAALVWDPIYRRLGTTQIHDHQSQITQGGIPLLVLDAWEHAYYAQYRDEKAKYFEAMFNLWNWEDVAVRYAAAQRVDLCIEGVVREAPRRPIEPEHHVTH